MPHPNAVRLALERARERTGRPPPRGPGAARARDQARRAGAHARRWLPTTVAMTTPKDTDDD